MVRAEVGEHLGPPLGRAPADLAGRVKPDPVVQVRDDAHRLVEVDNANLAERLGRCGEPEVGALHVEAALERGEAEPEMRVDGAFRGAQDGDGFAAFGRLVEQPAHHPGQDPAPPVVRPARRRR